MRRAELLEYILSPVGQAERELRLAEYEAQRTDPWRWYCRLCGAEDEHEDENVRDAHAYGHLSQEHDGRHMKVGTESHGHLRHVWTFQAARTD